MRVGFFTDTHLGSRIYANARNWRKVEGKPDVTEIHDKDILESFEEAVKVFLRERPDVVVHLGDLLEGKASSSIFRDLHISIEAFKRLLDSGIKLLLLEGNHDFRKYADRRDQPFSLIESALSRYIKEGKFLIVREGEYRIVDNWTKHPLVAVGYHREDENFRYLSETLNRASRELGNRKAVLLTHQTIGEVWNIPNFYRIENVPENFVYIFNGHIHKKRLIMRVYPSVHIFMNLGSVDYHSFSEALNVYDLLREYTELEREYGTTKATEMFKRKVLRGVVFLDLENANTRNLVDPLDAIKLGDVESQYWNSSREPVFYHPLHTSRPFLKAHVKDVENFKRALNFILQLMGRFEAKAPVLSVEAEVRDEEVAPLQKYLLDLIDGDKVAAFRMTLSLGVEGSIQEMPTSRDKFEPFGKYAPLLHEIESKVNRIIDMKEQLEEAKSARERKEIKLEIEKLREEVKRSIISHLRWRFKDVQGDRHTGLPQA